MSIKGAVKRLEGTVAKRGGTQALTFIIPHFRDPNQTEQIKNQMIREHGLASSSDALIDFSTHKSIQDQDERR